MQNAGISDKKRPKISCNPFIYYSFEQKTFLWKKISFYCGSHRTIKKGKENGYQRWFCKDCKRYFIGHRCLTKEDVNSTYSLENLTVSDLAREFGVSTRTIHRYLSSEYKENLPKLVSSNVVVLMDATYWGRRFGVVIMKDHISGRVLWYKFIDKKETITEKVFHILSCMDIMF